MAMRKIFKALGYLSALLFISIGSLAVFNHYDVQARGNGEDYDPSIAVLRTPEAAFAGLTDFPYTPRYLEINDDLLGKLRVHYIDEGPRDAHTIVLLHGQSTWSYSFRHMIPLFVDAGYRVVAPDLIGFGRSDKPADWEAHTFAGHVDWLEQTLDQLETKGATGFLFDWGGYFGLPVAARRPEFFSRLVLNTTMLPRANSVLAAGWVAWWRRYILKPEIFPISGMVADMTERELDSQTLSGLDAPYPSEAYKGGPRRFPMMIPATPLNPAHSANSAVWEELANWNKPVMTLIAASMTRGMDPRVLQEHLPGAADQPHYVYPDANFFLIEEDPEDQARRTIDFIEST